MSQAVQARSPAGGGIAAPAPEPRAGGWHAFARFVGQRPAFLTGLVIVGVTVFLAAVGPHIGPYPTETALPGDSLQPPSLRHPFGTDVSNMDIFSRVIAAPRIDLTIALVSTSIAFVLGVLLGVISGFFGGERGLARYASEGIMRAADIVQAFPVFIFALALVGESGSGKTTTGRCILRLIEPTAGAIRFDGMDLLAMDPRSFRALRPRVQMVFQEPYDSLSPRMRIGAIVEEPLKRAGSLGPAERRERVAEILDLVRLGSGSMYRYPHQFSAGQQQRIGIARALATRPDLVVLDEPTSALDVSVRAEVLDLLSDLRTDLGVSYLFISHDLTAVRRVCDRVAIMYLGKIVETGETEAIFERPLHPYSRALLSSVLYPDPRVDLPRFTLEGEIPSPINLPRGCHLHGRCPWAESRCGDRYPEVEWHDEGRAVSCHRAREMAAL